MQAATWLADRGFGKAPIAMDTGAGEPVQIIMESAFDDADQGAEWFRREVARLAEHPETRGVTS
jgi:hypothetical protein